MHKADANTEASRPPSPKIIQGMGPLMMQMMQAGVLVDGAGLHASSRGVRLTFTGGKRTVTEGPFVRGNELLSGMTIVRVTSLDEAIAWASRYAAIIGDTELDIRPVVEPWDIGFGTKPVDDSTMRFGWTHKATADAEAGTAPAPARTAALNALAEEMRAAGVLLLAESFQPSAAGVRLHFTGGKRQSMTDGPFAETKELIAGFSILDVPAIGDAIEWCNPFAALLGEVEVDVRPLYDPPGWR
jgi:hypothetical protein